MQIIIMGKIGETDPYIDIELIIIRGNDGELINTRVKRLSVDVDGKLIGLGILTNL